MSLDVSLKVPGSEGPARQAIFVRKDGQTVEVTREDWDKRNPGREPYLVSVGGDETVFSDNITSNLVPMAKAVSEDFYLALWHPEDIGAKKAKDISDILNQGLKELYRDPEKYKELNPANGWGSYDTLFLFVTRYLSACHRFPEADIYAVS